MVQKAKMIVICDGADDANFGVACFLNGGGGFSAKFQVGVCHPQFQNGTVG